MEAQKQNLVSSKLIIGKQNVDPSQLELGDQNVAPSKPRLGEQNVAPLEPKIDESNNLCGLQLIMVIIYNSNDGIILDINWEFQSRNGGLYIFLIFIH